MNQKRTVVAAGILSAVLVSASGAFAVTSGLFAGGRADQVGTFQAIEHVVAAQSTTTAPGKGTATKPSTGPGSTKSGPDAVATAPGSGESTSPGDGPDPTSVTPPPPAAAPAHSATPEEGPDDDDAPHGTSTTMSSPPPAASSTTSTSHPEDEHEYEHEDDGSESDD